MPARYSDRVACFNVVYITSNLPLEKQYVKIQKDAPSVWKAFLRRISVVVEFHKDGSTTERKLNDDE